MVELVTSKERRPAGKERDAGEPWFGEVSQYRDGERGYRFRTNRRRRRKTESRNNAKGTVGAVPWPVVEHPAPSLLVDLPSSGSLLSGLMMGVQAVPAAVLPSGQTQAAMQSSH
jgi:hypothetical protein